MIPDILKNEIMNGKIILYLGAGASMESIHKDNKKAPTGKQLGNLISDKFLGGEYKDTTLDWISELAISQTDLFTVQDYIKELFIDFNPNDFHLILPTFKWKMIFSTNYDLIIEKAYQKQDKRAQELFPIFTDSDRIEEKLLDSKYVCFIKLHGCITRTNDMSIPMILTKDQFIDYSKNRTRLFRLLEEKAYENTFIFIGSDGQDYDLRSIFKSLEYLKTSRPRFYMVKPNAKPEEVIYWESKRVTIIPGTFKEFLLALDAAIPIYTRFLKKTVDIKNPIENKYVSSVKISGEIEEVLNFQLQYIHSGIPQISGSPSKFYKGFDLGWYPILNDLDIKRDMINPILFDYLLNEYDRPSQVDFYLIKAEAGAGKSIFLKRLGYEAAIDGGLLCLFLKNDFNLVIDHFIEIYKNTNERIFLFVDNAADHVALLENLILKAKIEKLPLTVISTERNNEWNTNCDRLEPFVTKEFKLPYLNEGEIKELLKKLEQFDCLGYLQDKSESEKMEAFKKEAGRQLLVALYESTLGRPFEDILVDEFNQISPILAQSIYLTVCILNRLKVPVRAGIISRIYNLSFLEFKANLFRPLEHVVNVIEYTQQDYYYVARHSQIAQIVFERILKNPTDRYNEYSRVLNALNITYSTDRAAFRQLIKAKVLSQLFPDFTAVKELYAVAHEISKEDAFVYHQQGIYEMNRANGNLNVAYELLSKAHDLDEKDQTILHSFSELAIIKAETAKSIFERDRYLREAKKICLMLIKGKTSRNYGYTTLIKALMMKLRDTLKDDKIHSVEIDKRVIEIENYLAKGLQEFPDEPYLLSCEADLSILIANETRAIEALKKASEVDKRNPYIINRLTKIYLNTGEYIGAKKLLEEALEKNPGEIRLHFQYAKVLIEMHSKDISTLLHHLRRSFIKGDHNYLAQFWYARYLFELNDPESIKESKDIFKFLREAPITHDVRTDIRCIIFDENLIEKKFSGTIAKKEETYGFVRIDGSGLNIFFHQEHIETLIWDNLKLNMRVEFVIGFNFSGPIVLKIFAIT